MQATSLRALVLLLAIAIVAPSMRLQAQQPNHAALQSAGDNTEYYYADGKQVVLHEKPGWLAIATTTADPAVLRSLASNGVLPQTKAIRQLSPQLQIVEVASTQAGDLAAIQMLASSAKQSSSVAWAAPVYIGEDGGWLVANDEVIVCLRLGVSPGQFAGDARFANMRPLDGTSDQFVLKVAAGGGPAALALARDLASDARLVWASPNFYQERKVDFTPNDSLVNGQWHLNNTSQNGGTVDADADVFEAWDITAGGSSTITIAVIDDGMEYTHPDLAPNLFVNIGEIANNGIDDDGNGWVDDRNGWDFTTNLGAVPVGDNNPGPDSINDAHATAVAGVAAARGNNVAGVAGVAYNSRLLPIRVFGTDGNSTTDTNIATAIYYAAGRTRDGLGTWAAADVLNNSWGGGSPSNAITTALLWATSNGRGGRGTPAFFASGNGGSSSVSYPANLSLTNSGVIAVGASNDDDQRSLYSNAGSALDIVAPSNDTRAGHAGILTVDRVGSNGYNAGDYTINGEFGGTSSATPLASGIGALILARNANLTAAQVRGLLRNTTDLVGESAYTNGRNNEYGYGRVNARTAVQSIGTAEVQVLDGVADVSNGSSIALSTPMNQVLSKTLRVRNQGTSPLNLADLSVIGADFSLVAGFGDTSLAVGEATTAVISYEPTSAGASNGTMSFTTNDTNEAAFSILLNGTALVPSIAGTVYDDANKNGIRDSGELGQVGWTVFLDQNGNHQFDPASFTHSGEQIIPDNDATGLKSTLGISGTQATITDLNVRLNIAHSYVSDLSIELVGPNGKVVPLITNRGTSGDDFTNTVLDDEAAVSITTVTQPSSPFTGSYRPEQPLSVYDGIPMNGTWTLRIKDGLVDDTGSLLNWSLIFATSGEPTTLTDANGNYAFIGLAAGNYTVRRLIQNDWRSTAPGTAEYAIELADGDSVTERDFGNAPAYRAHLPVIRR